MGREASHMTTAKSKNVGICQGVDFLVIWRQFGQFGPCGSDKR